MEVRVRTVGPEARRVGPVFSYGCRGKMASADDVDGDGRLDLLVLVYKKTRYDAKPAWRPFVYTLRTGNGSRGLARRRLLEEVACARAEGVRMLTVERWPGKSVSRSTTGAASLPRRDRRRAASGLRVLRAKGRPDPVMVAGIAEQRPPARRLRERERGRSENDDAAGRWL
jgi:hypothetical protein